MVRFRLAAAGVVGALVMCLVAAVQGPAPSAGERTVPERTGLPLPFERNHGQADPQVRFLARGPGYRAFVTDNGLTVNGVRFTPVGANAGVEVSGGQRLGATVNYAKGADPSRWLSVPTFGQARASEVYPGIDIVYYGLDGELEYDFVVAPGADPGRIKVAIEGGGPIALTGGGDLAVGSLVQRRPVAYQEVGGRRLAVDASYRLGRGNTFGLRLGAYDRTLPLVIDPVITYATYLGGSTGGLGDDEGDAVTADASGNAYVTGRTATTDFPVAGGLDITRGGTDDAFVTKLSPTGAVLWSTYFGGDGFEQGFGISYSAAAGAVWVTGVTTSDATTFPLAGTPFDSVLGGPQDAFVARLSASTGALAYVTYFGGDDIEAGYGIAADPSGGAAVTGVTFSTAATFPLVSAADAVLGGTQDAFVARFTAAGALAASTYLGGVGDESGNGVAVDGSGRAYVTGFTTSGPADGFPLSSPFAIAFAGGQEAFVTAYTAAGSLLYSSYLGGDGGDEGFGIAADAGGTVYVAGSTSSTDLPASNGFDATLDGATDAFVAVVTPPPAPALSALTYLGGTGDEAAYAIAVDAGGHPYVTGATTSPPGPGGFPLAAAVDTTFGGLVEAFVTRFGAVPLVPFWSTYLGGDGDEEGFGIALGGPAVHVTGFTTSAAAFPLVAAFDSAVGGASDGFVARLAPDGVAPTCKITALIPGPPKQMQVTVQDTGGLAEIQNISITNGTVDVAPFTVGTTGTVVLTATKDNPSLPTSWQFEAVDIDGNVKLCK